MLFFHFQIPPISPQQLVFAAIYSIKVFKFPYTHLMPQRKPKLTYTQAYPQIKAKYLPSVSMKDSLNFTKFC